MTRRVVITGLGVVAPNGRDLATFEAALRNGRSAVGPIARFPASGYPTRIAAEVHDFDCGELDRITAFALEAGRQALDDAGLTPPEQRIGERSRYGVLIASGFGSYDHEEVFSSAAAGQPLSSNGASEGFDWAAFRRRFLETVKARPVERRTPGTVPTIVARTFELGGPVMSVMTACAAGTQALGDAARWIRSGTCDVVLAGGSDSEIYPMGLASFCLLRALSSRNDEPDRASRPFSASRDGFVLGEGSGMLVLEEREHARARGARIYGEILGFGSACDSYRVTDPHPEGVGATLAMQRALTQARLSPADVDYVNAHGTSTPLNDRIESHAVRTLFGAAAGRLAISSTKSMIGHLTVAAGAVEAIATLLMLRSGIAHPTINLDDPDPECDLDFVPNRARTMSMHVALSSSFAFGGQCASILLGSPEVAGGASAGGRT